MVERESEDTSVRLLVWSGCMDGTHVAEGQAQISMTRFRNCHVE